MSKIFFEDLGLPDPDYHLEVGSGSHAWQTAEILKRVEAVLVQESPDWVLVYGDTNSTLAGALAAAKLHLPVCHIEAGLRSHNRRMPEEINRVMTDHVSTLLCCPTVTAVANLRVEGFINVVNDGRLITEHDADSCLGQRVGVNGPVVVNTGDVMFDAFLICQKIAEKRSRILEQLKVEPGSYFLATVHRAENTDDREPLCNIVDAFLELSRHRRLLWPLHPRTRKALETKGLVDRLRAQTPAPELLPPVGYFDMLLLVANAAIILTDSGGVQKEALFSGVPCITLRQETEWVETVDAGLNTLAGTDPVAIKSATLRAKEKYPISNHFGAGDAAKRIYDCLTFVQ
jgi:UDP-N-acetylglucosamine 2-epimerase